jgi:phosphatidyl-myo-inositol alpha-mannosyltransferase
VDVDKYNPAVKPLEQYRDGKLNILFVSRLERRKGLGYLLKAYRLLKRDIPDSRLIVVGPGTMLKRQYELDIARYHLKDVVFTGFVSSADLPRYYQTADIFCAPAIGRESFGIILLEAMAAGKPIVASDIDGYASVLTDKEEGLLVPPKNGKALAEALATLARDKPLRAEMGKRGRVKAQRYRWERVAGEIFAYYQRILGEKSVPPRVDHSESNPLPAEKTVGG